MRWSLDNPDAYKVIEDYRRFGVPVPDELVPPKLYDVEWFFWEAFGDLSTCRDRGGGRLGPIPWTAMTQYAAQPGIDRGTFERIINAMDTAYLNHEEGDSKVFSRDMLKR